MNSQADCIVRVGWHTQLRFTVWVRGTEVAVQGYVEKADREVGMMRDWLVIEELVPVTPDPHWREPDIDDLLDSGEYIEIDNAFFQTYDDTNEWSYVVWCADESPDPIEKVTHEQWLDYWIRS